jgi:hypothetical protein
MKLHKGVVIGFVSALVVSVLFVVAAFIVDWRIGGIVSVIVLAILFSTYRTFIEPSLAYSRLLKTGIPGIGTILAISETGTWINNAPLCIIDLEVEIAGRPTYTTTISTVLSYFDAPQFQPGAHLPILVDPNNLMNAMLATDNGSPDHPIP